MDANKSSQSHLYRPPKPEALEISEPMYIRYPRKPDRCPHTGLSKSTLDLLVRPQALNDYDPPVKSKLMRLTDNKARVRLIDYKSLKEYLNSLPDGGPQGKPRAPYRKARKEVTP